MPLFEKGDCSFEIFHEHKGFSHIQFGRTDLYLGFPVELGFGYKFQNDQQPPSQRKMKSSKKRCLVIASLMCSCLDPPPF